MKNILLPYFVLIISFFGCKTNTPENVDLLVINAEIWTGNDLQKSAEAMAITQGKIVRIGTMEELADLKSSAGEIFDAQGAFITPGFIDSHVHFMMGGNNLSSVQLRDAKTKEEFIRRIKDFAASLEPGVWITGGDWDHENWGGELPDRNWIDSVTTDNPLWINRLDGHMSLANSLALSQSGIDDTIEDVEGGEVVRDGQRLTGVFKDNAAWYVDRHVPALSEQQLKENLTAAMNYVNSHGVTSVHDMGGWDDMALYRKMNEENSLTVRIYSIVPLRTWKKLQEEVVMNGRGDEWVQIGGLKGFVDGSLGSHTAAFFEPYTDSPTDSGFYLIDEKELFTLLQKADSCGLQLAVHAIGDKAIHMLLNQYKTLHADQGDKRYRIEHTQHLSPQDYGRFKALNVIPSMQPYHAIDDGRWAEKVIGSERIKSTYAFKSLLDNDAALAFGSDWFVAPPIPLIGIHAAVTRQTLDGNYPEGWVPEQKITVEEALRAYTQGGAYASFQEDIKGTLEIGK
ncbi:MAG: amidohydrolase, partial [Cyclobacteriaceae bacterium]|nr:amidohydrolase [Cyclobacteriaceae bacterium]